MPLLLVAAGSGISGIRTILEERAYWKKQGYDVGASKLIFGIHCRTKDFLCQKDWNYFKKIGILEQVYLAESRPLYGDKKYVQHLLLQDNFKTDLQAIVKQKTAIVICGDWQMGRSLLKAYLPFLLSIAQAEQLPEDLQANLHNPSRTELKQLFEFGLVQVSELRNARFICASASGSRHQKRKFSEEEEFEFFLKELGWEQMKGLLARVELPVLV